MRYVPQVSFKEPVILSFAQTKLTVLLSPPLPPLLNGLRLTLEDLDSRGEDHQGPFLLLPPPPSPRPPPPTPKLSQDKH